MPQKAKTWACPDCKTTDTALRYPSGKINRCLDCQKYYNLSVNSTKSKRTRVAPPKLELTREQFVAWVRASERVCIYCGLREADVPRIGMKTQIGLDLQALGIDRIDSSLHYAEGNLGLCCFACNKAKGNVFSAQEMHIIGKAIAEVWAARLAGASRA